MEVREREREGERERERVRDNVISARDKLGLGADPYLCEVKSSGGKGKRERMRD